METTTDDEPHQSDGTFAFDDGFEVEHIKCEPTWSEYEDDSSTADDVDGSNGEAHTPLLQVATQEESTDKPNLTQPHGKLDPCVEGGVTALDTFRSEQVMQTAGGTLRVRNVEGGQRSKGRRRPLECRMCEMTFKRKENLAEHLRLHVDGGRHRCERCGRHFTQTSLLVLHRNSCEKPHQCGACGKRFSSTSRLALHNKMHTGVRLHRCAACGKEFNQSTDLAKHGRTHTGEKPYTCTACGRRFSQTSHLTRHAETHTGAKPHRCEVCGKHFSRSTALARHGETHTGEKPHGCDVCGRRFTVLSSLTRHGLMHATGKALPVRRKGRQAIPQPC